jgi:hypothetical protein
MSAVEVELARGQWEDGSKRFDDDVRFQPRMLDALEVVTDELRRRVGQTFTLGELAVAYAHADDWARIAVGDRTPYPGWPRGVTTVLDTAFHVYARGASDYAP